MIWAAGLVTGAFWLVMGITGAVSWVAALTSRPVVRGLVLGLGLSFVLEGVTLMHRGPGLAIAGAALTFLLLSQSRVPAMLVLLVYGGVAALLTDTTLVSDLAGLSLGFRFPALGLPALDLCDLTQGCSYSRSPRRR